MSVLIIVESAEKVSSNYHEGGGIAVVAESEEAARALCAAHPTVAVSDGEWSMSTLYRLDGFYEPRVYVFPDAGCC